MKITKKLPLKPRGRADEKKHTTRDAIRAAYTNGPRLEVQVIPAKRDVDGNYAPKPNHYPRKSAMVCVGLFHFMLFRQKFL